jgi:hypothetical protein
MQELVLPRATMPASFAASRNSGGYQSGPRGGRECSLVRAQLRANDPGSAARSAFGFVLNQARRLSML